MKKATPLLVMVFSVAHYAHAQSPPPSAPSVEKAAQEYRQQEESLATFQRSRSEKPTDDEETDAGKRRAELRQLVKKSFDARQKLRYAQVKELQRRLHDIELAIGKSQANEEAVIDARVDALLVGAPAAADHIVEEQYIENGQVKTVRRTFSQAGETVVVLPGPIDPAAVRYPAPVAGPVLSPERTIYQESKEPRDRAADHFDIDTRERLAQVDVEEATAKRDAAKADYEAHKQANEKARGSTPQLEMERLEAALRVAEAELKRAKTMLEGMARERARLPELGEDAAQATGPSLTRQGQAERAAAKADIDTRERLAQIDLEEAIATRDAAVKELEVYTQAPGAVPQARLQKAEAAMSVAKIGVKRAQTKLAGIARERSELIAEAEAEVGEAEAAGHKAEARRQASIAQAEAVEAEAAKAEADAANALKNVAALQKQYDRVKQLGKQGAVPERQIRETENELETAKGVSESLAAGVIVAKTKARQAKSTVEEAEADLDLAGVRLRAAKARRDRLAGPLKTSESPTPATGVSQ